MLVCAALLLILCCMTLQIESMQVLPNPAGAAAYEICISYAAAPLHNLDNMYVCAMQIQFNGMTLYDCGVTYDPNHPESNPACTRVTNVQQSLRLQASTVVVTYATFQHLLCILRLVWQKLCSVQHGDDVMIHACIMSCKPFKTLFSHFRPNWWQVCLLHRLMLHICVNTGLRAVMI